MRTGPSRWKGLGLGREPGERTEGKPSSQSNPSLLPDALRFTPPAVLTYFEDARVAQWLIFSDVWNAVSAHS